MSVAQMPGSKNPSSLGIGDYQELDAATPSWTWFLQPRHGSVVVQTDILEAGSYRVEVTAQPNSKVEAGTAIWRDVYGADQSAGNDCPILAAWTHVRVTRISGKIAVAISGQ